MVHCKYVPQLNINKKRKVIFYVLNAVEDLERHDGSAEKPYYMSTELMKILGTKNKGPKSSKEK